MNLTTTTQKQIHQVEQHGDSCLASLISFAECLNRAHKDFWDKSDEDLQTFLQALYEQNSLFQVFEDHLFYTTKTNEMLVRYGYSPICNAGILKPFAVVDGVITFEIPAVEPVPEEQINTPHENYTEPEV
jgi:hypothetical protein